MFPEVIMDSLEKWSSETCHILQKYFVIMHFSDIFQTSQNCTFIEGEIVMWILYISYMTASIVTKYPILT